MTQLNSILDLIGNTPLIKAKGFDVGPCTLWLKLENQNPGGSIKDRIALSMIDTAEKAAHIAPGDTLVEASAGNTGIALCQVAIARGYHCLIVIPDKMSREKITHLKLLGAEIITTRSDVEKGHPEYYQDLAADIAEKRPGHFYIGQFANTANPLAHETSTGPEIWTQTQGEIDAFVCGIGTGGTMTGVGRYLRSQKPKVELILADPLGSILTDYVNKGITSPPGKWLVEGIGEDYIPSICDISLVNQAIQIDDKTAFETVRQLARTNGILAGTSSGTLVAAAVAFCQAQTTHKTVVTLICDTGNKYLGKLGNSEWLRQHGLGE